MVIPTMSMIAYPAISANGNIMITNNTLNMVASLLRGYGVVNSTAEGTGNWEADR